MWPQNVKSCSHNSKCDCKILKVAVTFRIMTAIFNILRSHFEICNHVTATFNILQSHFELWLQLSTFCSHISNYDCNFQHFAVTFRIMIAKCWNLQSHLGLLKLSAPHIPAPMIETIIVPIAKNKCGNLCDSNYRPITLATLMSKLFESVILLKCETFLETCPNQSNVHLCFKRDDWIL